MCIDTESPRFKKQWEVQKKVADKANKLLSAAALMESIMERKDVICDTDSFATAIEYAEECMKQINDQYDELKAADRESVV